jgi:hypothetical protein
MRLLELLDRETLLRLTGQTETRWRTDLDVEATSLTPNPRSPLPELLRECAALQRAAVPVCPSGPLETDRVKIAAALASMPALPKALGREHPSSTKPEAWTLIDGVATGAGGGLAPPTREGQPVSLSARVEYDANRCVARYVRTEATLRGDRLADERFTSPGRSGQRSSR